MQTKWNARKKLKNKLFAPWKCATVAVLSFYLHLFTRRQSKEKERDSDDWSDVSRSFWLQSSHGRLSKREQCNMQSDSLTGAHLSKIDWIFEYFIRTRRKSREKGKRVCIEHHFLLESLCTSSCLSSSLLWRVLMILWLSTISTDCSVSEEEIEEKNWEA